MKFWFIFDDNYSQNNLLNSRFIIVFNSFFNRNLIIRKSKYRMEACALSQHCFSLDKHKLLHRAYVNTAYIFLILVFWNDVVFNSILAHISQTFWQFWIGFINFAAMFCHFVKIKTASATTPIFTNRMCLTTSSMMLPLPYSFKFHHFIFWIVLKNHWVRAHIF